MHIVGLMFLAGILQRTQQKDEQEPEAMSWGWTVRVSCWNSTAAQESDEQEPEAMLSSWSFL
jgi:hypothetical protein